MRRPAGSNKLESRGRRHSNINQADESLSSEEPAVLGIHSSPERHVPTVQFSDVHQVSDTSADDTGGGNHSQDISVDNAPHRDSVSNNAPDLPPAYSELSSGPPFCYGFVAQQRNLLTRLSSRSGDSYTNTAPPRYRASNDWYDGFRLYVPPHIQYGVDENPASTRTRVATNRVQPLENPGEQPPKASAVVTNISTFIVLIFWLLVPTAALLVGSVFINSCPIERNVPVFVIISGAVLLLRGIVFLAKPQNCAHSLGTFLDLFTIFWIVLGSFWVFSIVKHVDYNYDPTGDNSDYCHKTLFAFALWLLTTFYILFGLAWTFVLICICVYLVDRGGRQRRQRSQTLTQHTHVVRY